MENLIIKSKEVITCTYSPGDLTRYEFFIVKPENKSLVLFLNDIVCAVEDYQIEVYDRKYPTLFNDFNKSEYRHVIEELDMWESLSKDFGNKANPWTIIAALRCLYYLKNKNFK